MSKWILGGPSYQLSVDARHAANMVHTGLMLGKHLHAINYRHGVPVETPRNGLFQQALDISEVDFVLWADSDVFGWDQSILHIAKNLEFYKKPLCGIPVNQRNGDSNVWLHQDKKLAGTIPVSTDLHECWAIGFGFVMFWLPWYREHFNKGPYFRTEWNGDAMQSEDVWHCRELARRGESPYYAMGAQLIHAHRGV